MADITVQDIQKLRQDAGVGMMDAKKALVETGSDAEAATARARGNRERSEQINPN